MMGNADNTTPHSADFFDPYGEHPDVQAMPINEAITRFQSLLDEIPERSQRLTLALRDGTSTPETRLAASVAWQLRFDKETLRLFRSIAEAPR